MGGNALKNIQTRRLARADVEPVSRAVVVALQQALPGMLANAIPAYATKADFGDLDVMVTAEEVEARGLEHRLHMQQTMPEPEFKLLYPSEHPRYCAAVYLSHFAEANFNATETYRNDNVVSFDYRASAAQTEPGFQVDVITMPRATYGYALNYYSFNDLGNLIGRTAHKMGLSHGHEGLVYYFRDGDYLFRTITLTRDYEEALAFLGYDPARFRHGFETLEDIFEYVAGSRYFNRDIFLLENRNAAARVRDKKRKTYREFLQWCEARPDLPYFKYPESKDTWLGYIASRFPHFQQEHEQAISDLRDQRTVKARFSGDVVRGMTGLEGLALNRLIEQLKLSVGGTKEQLRAFVLRSSDEEVRDWVMRTWNQMKMAAA